MPSLILYIYIYSDIFWLCLTSPGQTILYFLQPGNGWANSAYEFDWIFCLVISDFTWVCKYSWLNCFMVYCLKQISSPEVLTSRPSMSSSTSTSPRMLRHTCIASDDQVWKPFYVLLLVLCQCFLSSCNFWMLCFENMATCSFHPSVILSLREVWPPGPGHQPDHLWGPLQPEVHRGPAGDRH